MAFLLSAKLADNLAANDWAATDGALAAAVGADSGASVSIGWADSTPAAACDA